MKDVNMKKVFTRMVLEDPSNKQKITKNLNLFRNLNSVVGRNQSFGESKDW
jgi:hypothetical protein